jgi:hypothetical protein
MLTEDLNPCCWPESRSLESLLGIESEAVTVNQIV